jgi:DNA polymerase I-like protein with 3'-5' exonuclease and polymerase domains
MNQPKGLGTRVEWNDPADYAESIFGFRRYFTLENQICKALFDLAENPPPEWQKIKVKVIRRDREQTVCGALRSALFASSFALQAANMRAAGNHVIQSTGATITKRLQCLLWESQPVGIHPWKVMPCNFHDEIMCPIVPELSDSVKEKVNAFIESNKAHVPLIGMTWKQNLDNWATK